MINFQHFKNVYNTIIQLVFKMYYNLKKIIKTKITKLKKPLKKLKLLLFN